MTTIYKLLMVGIIASLSSAMPTLAADKLTDTVFNSNPERDTVIIKFGKNSQIILYIDNKKDLEKISQYDINRMLQDLNMSITEMDDSTKVLTIEDETGSKYLKDTTIIITKIEPDNNWDSDSDEGSNKRRYSPRSKYFFNLDIALDNYLESGEFPNGNELYAVNPIGSWYWAFGPTYRTHLFGAVFIDLGMNAALNVYRFDNPRTRLNKTPTGIEFTEDLSAVAHKKSKLATWHIQAKAIPMIAFGSDKRKSFRLWNQIDKGVRFGVGPYAGYRIWSRTKYIYDENGDKKKDKNTGNFLLNNVRYGLRGQFGFKGIDLFVEYDLNEMFQADSGAPVLQRIQFGITL
ncbi:MAG: hypothetical protein L3J29_11235 [Cyclobacteriaceae bacterium]|nr:hypothetical protein [Cyclobacteriaceae bacterium]